jgi:dTDP-4-dehydrorhamnose 3,5-epimerase
LIASPTALSGAYVIDLDPRTDTRGFFARFFCAREFSELGLAPVSAQGNLSFNHRKGTVRGLHFQWPPYAETKLVRCTRGALLDVVVDLRPESPTYLRHMSVELTANNRRALYVPARFAHGYQTLEDDTEVMYLTGEFYTPNAEGGLRYDDERLAINWPLPAGDMSAKDRAWRPLHESERVMRARMRPSEQPDDSPARVAGHLS